VSFGATLAEVVPDLMKTASGMVLKSVYVAKRAEGYGVNESLTAARRAYLLWRLEQASSVSDLKQIVRAMLTEAL
jgi:hypothetical protein